MRKHELPAFPSRYDEGSDRLENYTKYQLKPREELLELLKGRDDLFIVACNKCFKEFTAAQEPELKELLELAASQGKTVVGSARVDFLCNKTQTLRSLQVPQEARDVLAVCCGLGVQTLAAELDKSVYAAADSIHYTGHHGMALTKKACEGCGQCYLNLTGGICPVVECSKSLVNGQCGGAKDGKCEVDPSKDCAWEKIQQRLAAQGRLAELKAQPVQLRDWSKNDRDTLKDTAAQIRARRLEGYYGGVHPNEHKEYTEHLPLAAFPEPARVTIPMSMHAGAPAAPIVAVGDHVDMGQKIGESAGFISCCVHASVSGTVVAIEDRPHATRGTCLAGVIENDGKYTVHESVRPVEDPDSLTQDDVVALAREKGIVGMGGAGFPTSVKLKPPKPVDTILLNGCECEPYLTADHRVLLEYPEDVIDGLKLMVRITGARQGIIVIEDNKPDAIALMEEKLAGYEDLRVCVAKTKYPQGAEKMLIKRCLGRQVPSGGLPADVGCVVGNISTTKALADAVKTGMPLIARAVTVTGEHIAKPGNYWVRIGTSTAELIAHCGGITGENVTVKAGGPMMGFVQKELDVPIMKGSNGIIAVDTDRSVAQPCIQCGRCVDVCPMELKPLYFAKFADQENWQGCKDYAIMDCLECRCCEYICSSKIPLVTKIKAGKAAVRGMK